MTLLLAILSVLAFMGFLVVGSTAKGAVHEIEALILLLISAVLFVGAGLSTHFDGIGRPLRR